MYKNCIVRWMPAHLDEEANAKKLQKSLKAGGTQTHIDGNCAVDALAKDGANCVQIDQTRHAMYRLRAWLTKTMQNYLVDVWKAEKLRMFESNITDPGQQLEVQSIIDIEAAQCEYEEQPDDPYDEDDGDIFGHCDINGNEVLELTEAHDMQDIRHDPALAPSALSPSADNNEIGMLHFSHSVNKDICTTFSTRSVSDNVTYANKFTTCYNKIGKPINYFLLNNDFVDVMQQLHALPDKRVTVSYSVGSSVSSSSSGHNKNSLHTKASQECNVIYNNVPTINDNDSTICLYLQRAFS